MKVTVLGAGVWGTTIGTLLAYNNKVTIWSYKDNHIKSLNEGKHPKLGIFKSNATFTSGNIKKAVKDSEFIFIALPTQKIEENIRDLDLKDKSVVILSKGLYLKDLSRLSLLFKEAKSISTLYGPTHSTPLISGSMSTLVLSNKDKEKGKKVKELFDNISFLSVVLNQHIEEAEYIAAFKNSYAIAYGILEGLSIEDKNISINTKSAFFSFILKEISSLLKILNLDDSSILDPNGIGDILVTCLQGRNRTFGELIGKGLNVEDTKEKIGMVVEGLPTTEAIYRILKEKNINLPINSLVYSILKDGKSSKSILKIFEEI